jgi:putative oxidoreductase
MHNVNLGLLIIRVGLGFIFMVHGYPKLVGGISSWQWLGSQMGFLGIHFLPIMWGLIAACVEFFGGALLALGFGTRFISLLLAFQMFIALLYHLNKGDSFAVYSHPIALLVVFVGLVITGAGRFSFDMYFK